MKKMLLLLCLITLGVQLIQAQKLDSATAASRQKMYDYYWNKRNRRNNTGWALLGTGTAAIGLGFLVGQDGYSDDLPPLGSFVLVGGGLLADLISIRYFVAASEYKRKARFALTGERVNFGNGFVPNTGYVALSMTFPL